MNEMRSKPEKRQWTAVSTRRVLGERREKRIRSGLITCDGETREATKVSEERRKETQALSGVESSYNLNLIG